MKITLLFVTILILGFTAFGQSLPTALPEMQEKEDWQTFVPAEEFTLEVPGTAAFGIVNAATADTIESRSYMIFANGSYYYIFSDDLKTPYQYTMALKFAESNAPGIRQNVVYNFSDKFGFHHKILMVKTDNRIYTFQSISLTKDNPSTTRFFAGIKIKGNLLQAKDVLAENQNQPEPSTTTQAPTVKTNTTSAVSPPKAYLGSGNGISSGLSNSPKTSNSDVPKTLLRIISKPRPAYTDYARFYQIAGIVRVRVVFLANGTIGTVTPVTKLPFGLTEQALTAARGMTFEPVTIDGVAQTVTKQVEYNFLIY